MTVLEEVEALGGGRRSGSTDPSFAVQTILATAAIIGVNLIGAGVVALAVVGGGGLVGQLFGPSLVALGRALGLS